MKCPDKDLTDGLHDMFEDVERNKCPKCGREMGIVKTHGQEFYYCTDVWCIPKEKVNPDKKCIHEFLDSDGFKNICKKCGLLSDKSEEKVKP